MKNMSKAITLICPQSITMYDIASVLEVKFPDLRAITDSNECYIDNYFQDKDEVKYVSIRINKELDYIAVGDYLEFENAPKEFIESLTESNFVHVSYNYTSFYKCILKEMLSGFESLIEKIWVDNDYGRILQAKAVLHGLKEDLHSFSLYP